MFVFASLQNKFSNYRTCSLRIDIEENIISEALPQFNTLAISAPHYSISREAFAVSELVYTTEPCAAPGGVYTTRA